MNEQTETIINIIKETFGDDKIIDISENSHPICIEIHEEFLIELCDFLYRDERTYFDSLSSLTGLDNGPKENSLEVIYNLYSIPFDIHLMIKVKLDRDIEKPTVQTVSHIWKTALWHEREAFDLLGIYFEGHPDLRRILLPNDWEGHPLRKDYEHQEKYHGITVEY
ncbi:NADH-quinone oxidoreductase subunit C [Aureibacter tunicatorum]|uniref:NADH-quinone oxidoreductase subunit C n=1 Tax=Aureibacter tunicatorum TaxID=866807 RepID=A0AAE3XJN1_9BACT|nr:NADH-quinone oxidoreductase subunit C [Aureibacter tunicatorum]MDR6237680.1 NADH-quinone oxidoreductase subunit C [Aureibacter tunicatorum]BDD02715.1 NADH-quinone oxidoreductase subunit C [Aureibacter tunicatorum]